MQVFVFKFPASYYFCVNISLKQHRVLDSYSDIYECYCCCPVPVQLIFQTITRYQWVFVYYRYNLFQHLIHRLLPLRPVPPPPPPPPPYFWTKLRPEGSKKIFFQDRCPHLSQDLDDPPPPPSPKPLSEGLDPPLICTVMCNLHHRQNSWNIHINFHLSRLHSVCFNDFHLLLKKEMNKWKTSAKLKNAGKFTKLENFVNKRLKKGSFSCFVFCAN